MVGWWAADIDAKAAAVLDALPGREALRKRLGELMKAGSIDGVVLRGERLFVLKRSGSESQPRLYVRDRFAESPHLALDAAAVSGGGAWALDWWTPSLDGALLAYGMTEMASGESVLRVRDVDSALDLPDRIPRTPGSSVAWLADRTGFFYTRLPKPGEVPDEELSYHRKVYFHALGTDPLVDPVAFGRGRPKEEVPEVQMSPNGRYLMVTARRGSTRTELWVSDLKGKTTDFFAVAAGVEAVYEAKFHGDTIFILTDEDAPRGRIAATDLRKPFRVLGRKPKARAWRRPNWREIVPEGPFTIVGFEPAGSCVAVSVLERGASRLRVHDLEGEGLREVPLPAFGAVRGLAGLPGADGLFVLHETFLAPPALLRYGLADGSLSVVDALPPIPEPAAWEARQESFLGKDGAAVSVFLVAKKGLRKDRNAPTIVLASDGGRGRAAPFFAPHLAAWFGKGGLLAVPDARGADDIEAAARWLIAGEYTRPERMAVVGLGPAGLSAAGVSGADVPPPLRTGSGLSAAAAAVAAPEVFRAAVLASPVTDLLNLSRMPPGLRRASDPPAGPGTGGGTASGPGRDRALAALSPLYRVEQGVAYPAFLVTAGDWDHDVSPAHGRKLVARLQSSTSSGRPVLLRMRPRPGRERGLPLGLVLDDLADRYGFLMWQLGVK